MAVNWERATYFVGLDTFHGVLDHHSSVQELFQHSSEQSPSDVRFCVDHPIWRNYGRLSAACIGEIPDTRTIDMVFHHTQESGNPSQICNPQLILSFEIDRSAQTSRVTVVISDHD